MIPCVVTSVWQHVTRPLSLTLKRHTHSSTPDCKAPRLSAGSSGYGRPAGQTLWKPFSHTHSPPPQGSGGGIRLPVQRRPGLALAAACDLRCLCMRVFYLPLFEGIATQCCCLLQVCRCDLQCRRFTLMHTHINLTSSSAPKNLE